ncbi:Transposable element Tcb2 transposase, partial [Harpegnathos saltator]
WILQEDNDPKHRSKFCTEWKEQSDIVTLDWPSQSLDANPIENVWAYLKHKLRGKRV